MMTKILENFQICNNVPLSLKAAATDMRYFATSTFSMSLVHKKNVSFICQLVFKLGYLFCQERGKIPSLNEIGEKSQATIILGKFVNQAINSHWPIVFGKCFSLVKI